MGEGLVPSEHDNRLGGELRGSWMVAGRSQQARRWAGPHEVGVALHLRLKPKHRGSRELAESGVNAGVVLRAFRGSTTGTQPGISTAMHGISSCSEQRRSERQRERGAVLAG